MTGNVKGDNRKAPEEVATGLNHWTASMCPVQGGSASESLSSAPHIQNSSKLREGILEWAQVKTGGSEK